MIMKFILFLRIRMKSISKLQHEFHENSHIKFFHDYLKILVRFFLNILGKIMIILIKILQLKI